MAEKKKKKKKKKKVEIFDTEEELVVSLARYTAIKDSPKLPPERITFTFPVINWCEYIAVVVAGPGEVDAVGKVSGNGGGGDGLPARMVSAEGELMWFLNKDAASKL